MLFQAGALWRLNELGYLPRLDRISSVSRGSITAGVLASRWNQLSFDQNGSPPITKRSSSRRSAASRERRSTR
jgi:predicted acylesterase/phospholipase RssA